MTAGSTRKSNTTFTIRYEASTIIKPQTAIQPSAVVERDGKPVVFLVQDGRAKQAPVTRGAKIGELLAVQGVKPGDVVVLAPSEKLGDGSKVSVAKK